MQKPLYAPFGLRETPRLPQFFSNQLPRPGPGVTGAPVARVTNTGKAS